MTTCPPSPAPGAESGTAARAAPGPGMRSASIVRQAAAEPIDHNSVRLVDICMLRLQPLPPVGSFAGPFAEPPRRLDPGQRPFPRQGESQYVEFSAPIELRANFPEATMTGCIGCTGDIEVETLHLWPAVAWRGPDPDALPTDYEVHLGPAPFNPDGTFSNSALSVRHPERSVTQTEGVWGGQFSNVPDRDGNPRRVVGFGGVRFDEADGSIGSFEGIFSALTPATVRPPESETPGTP